MLRRLKNALKPYVPNGVWGWRYKRRLRRLDKLVAFASGQVLSGPFKGMKYLQSSVGSAIGPKILGCYESELAAIIEQLQSEGFDHVIDVGAAEGYYAVGLLFRDPKLHLTAFESETEGREAISKLAELNQVLDRINIKGFATSQLLGETINPAERTCLIVDIEGGEVEVLDPHRVPALASAHILVEIHDFMVAGAGRTLRERFSPTHNIQQIANSARRWKDLPHIAGLSRLDVADLANEGRPHTTPWYWMVPQIAPPTR